MEAIQNILRFLDARASTPSYFGVFHIVSIALTIAIAVVLCILWKKEIIKNVSKVVLIFSLVLLILGLYKQVVLSFVYEPTLDFNYNWDNFPWQFMSIPLVIGLFIGATSGHVNKHMQSYFVTFGLLAGLWGMFNPDTFVPTIGLNVYAMMCYGSFIALAILILVSQQIKIQITTFFKALPIFVMVLGIAISFNEIAHLIFPWQRISMFSVSPHFESDIPVYSLLHNALLASGGKMIFVEYLLCLVVYFVFISACAFVPFGLIVGIKKLFTTDFDAEYVKYDDVAQSIIKGELLDPKDDTEEIFKFNSKVNTKRNTYRQTYFKNLHTKFGVNNKGSCGYIALSMLLTYYDTTFCDAIIPVRFDEPTTSKKEPNFKESPGANYIYYVPEFDPAKLTYKEYVRSINRNKNFFLHERLLKIALKKHLNDVPEFKKSVEFDFRSSVDDIKKTADYFLDHDSKLKSSEYSIDVKKLDDKTTPDDIRKYVITKIKQGYPVWVGITDIDQNVGHAVVAYEYDEETDKIYCHFGYHTMDRKIPVTIQRRKKEVVKEVKKREAYTHLVPEEQGFELYTSALVLDFHERKVSHTHTDNYEVYIRKHKFFYCPDGTYTTPDDLIVEFNRNKHKLVIDGVYGKYPQNRLFIFKKYGKVKVAKIKNGAFKDQTHITYAHLICEIPYIPRKAFQGCKNLEEVIIDNSIRKLKAKCFAGCKSLKIIKFQGTVNQWYKLRKSGSWDRNTGKYQVYCNDGILYKFGADYVKFF